MSSPFLHIDPSHWIASNSLAFAIRDAHPVSPGHTLIIPRRLIPTWFEATREEHTAIFELVHEIKRKLDEELHPDGYNVGFNAGEAAGQTVMHLHVHVIPRFAGDMEDPRGGVRIDGGLDGFKERAVSLTDIGWVLAAFAATEHDVDQLDESRAHRLRYLDGTPKASTRWIDTAWALLLVKEWMQSREPKRRLPRTGVALHSQRAARWESRRRMRIDAWIRLEAS